MMEIFPVETKKDLKKFIELPYRIYRDDNNWVAPLRSELAGQFDPVRNPFLEHCRHQLFLLFDGDKLVGRIAAFIDHLAVDFWQEPIGLFGYFEAPSDQSASQLLLKRAREWLILQGMKKMRGPWSFVSQEWGSVVEGYSPAPVVMSPYNPPFYNDQYEIFGLRKIKDLLVYQINASENYQIPDRILTLTDKIRTRYGIHTRNLNMKALDQDVKKIIALSNESLIKNWGYSPVTDAEVRAMVHDLKQIIQAKGVIFAEDQYGNAVGFAIAIPDINVLLKGLNGRLLPFGWLKLLKGIPKLKQYRMFALGVVPAYHGKGIDSLLYRALYESIYSPDMKMEINYVLEDNDPMNNAINKLGASLKRRYRVYEMDIEESGAEIDLIPSRHSEGSK
jgi:ribosomal protein S18 acetylase RimI-like enzyme